MIHARFSEQLPEIGEGGDKISTFMRTECWKHSDLHFIAHFYNIHHHINWVLTI